MMDLTAGEAASILLVTLMGIGSLQPVLESLRFAAGGFRIFKFSYVRRSASDNSDLSAPERSTTASASFSASRLLITQNSLRQVDA